jgi:SAM-dependent methyltransferase
MPHDDRERWNARYRDGLEAPGPPSPFLVEHLADLRGEVAMDVAAGTGRHALWLARCGLRVHAIDVSEAALRRLAALARAQHLPVRAVVTDIASFPVPATTYDVVVNVNFLYRPVLPRLAEALRPQGVLVFETFLAAQAAHGHPKNPAYLLAPGELRACFADRLEILDYREGPVERDAVTVHVASLLARRDRRVM